MKTRTIYLAGGCFWGLEDLMREQPGVLDTDAGYSGGENENPTYQNHPGHAEAISITFDEEETSYSKLLDYYFRIHDPTTKDQQGNDRGSAYRSAIFYQTEEEKQEAESVIQMVNDSGLYENSVVTTLEPFKKFWLAEDFHQDYLINNPGGYTCHYVRSNQSLLT